MHNLDWAKFSADIQQPFELVKTPVLPQAVAREQRSARGATLMQPPGAALLDATSGEAYLVLDFGRETVSHVHFEVQATGDATLQVFYGEDLLEAMREQDYTDGWYHLPRDEYSVGPGSHQLQSAGRRAFRYVRLAVKQGAPLQVHRVSATLVHYSVELRGRFSCSDAQLNHIWEISEWTTRLCMQQYYEDGIKRDGLCWIGDYRVQYLCAALLYGDTKLARKSLGLSALSQFEDGRLPANAIRAGAQQHPSNIEYMFDLSGEQQQEAWIANWKLTNYEADYVSCVREYYDLSGDRETVQLLWPSVVRVLDVLGAVDVINCPLDTFITDDQPDHDGWWSSRGALAGEIYQAVRDAAYLAEHLNDGAVVARCREHSQRLAQEFEKFYSPQDGAYHDEPIVADANARVSWHANAFAVLSGLVDEERARELLQNVDGNVSARYMSAGFMEFYRLQSTFMMGMTDEALAEIRRYWGHMLRYDATSCWDVCDTRSEGIARPDTHAMSHCHGWSAGPAYLLPTYVLGVQSTEPGFKRVRIAPQLGDLQWAEGVVPTPHGDIMVHWDHAETLQGTINLPMGIEGEVVLPALNGTRIVPLQTGENYIS
jgi:hypothetical protein